MKSIKAVVNRVVNPAAKKRGMIHGKIILEWDKIVGQKFATYCAPEKISFRQGLRSRGTLHLKVNPSHALLLTHSQDLVIEKINSYFGYPAVAKLRLIQVPFSPSFSSPHLSVVKKDKASQDDKAKLSPKDRLYKALEDLKVMIDTESSRDKNKKS